MIDTETIKKPQEVIDAFRASLPPKSESQLWLDKVIDFTVIFGDSFGSSLFELLGEAEALAREKGLREMEVIAFLNKRFVRVMTKGTTGLADINDDPANMRPIVDNMRKNKWHPLALNMIAYDYWFRGEYDKGFETVFDALRATPEDNHIMVAWQHFCLGVFYFDTSDLDASYNHYAIARASFEAGNYIYGRARAMNGMASVLIRQNNAASAIPLLDEASGVYADLSHYTGLSRSLNDLGLVARMQCRFDEALAYFDSSIRLREDIDHIQGLITSHTEKAETFLQTQKFDEALSSLAAALANCQKTTAQQKESRIHRLYYEVLKAKGNTAGALTHFEEFFRLRTLIMSDEATNRIRRLRSNFEKESAEKQAEIERLRHVELRKAYQVIEQKNKDIRDSINYAKRIQNAIMPNPENIRMDFPSFFILYKPKDIVAGDFYFYESTATHAFMAAADCTGHGVPGALVSVACSNALSRSVKEFNLIAPGEILDKTRELLMETFSKSGTDIRDGMDISLLVKDRRNNSCAWAGANNPLWIVSDGALREIGADKQCVGYNEEQLSFTTHELRVRSADRLYLFTDGFADQFGGPGGKKFKYRKLIALLESLSKMTIGEQGKALDGAFEDWRGDIEQVDDVCIIGVEV
jgi:serine phosphatase RsbU (regulator of sigma subunit)